MKLAKNTHSTIRAWTIRTLLAAALPPVLAACESLPAPSGDPQSVSVAPSQAYRCSNDLEVQCDPTGCTSSDADDFTPMSVDFDDAGGLSVCAYTGCWEGRADVLSVRSFMVLTGHDFKFSSAGRSDDEGQHIAVALDLTDGVAILKAGSFTQPLLCETVAP